MAWVTVAAALSATLLAVLGAGQVQGLLKEGGWTVAGTGPDIVDTELRRGTFTGANATTVVLVVQDTFHTADDPEFHSR
ncbi:MAG: hypothetical protein LBH76_01895, partial [Propionibacteriaceae bacterium]|nr:hypothetical protein [Propionibacteriaceae bacterium]